MANDKVNRGKRKVANANRASYFAILLLLVSAW